MWSHTLASELAEHGNKREQQFHELCTANSELCGSLILNDRQLINTICVSDYVADSLLHFPELIAPLMQRGFISSPLNIKAIQQELENVLNRCADETQLYTCLRLFKRLHQMRLIWRDINNLCELPQLLSEITALADISLTLCLNWQMVRFVKRYGQPIGKHSAQPQALIILAMGKQGAKELNLSSDIDLIFCYHEYGETKALDNKKSQACISNQEFFIKLGQAVIQSLDKVTSDGFVYRVDMRLRPYGQSGPLVMNFSSLENYYHEQGREWERYAMIKARAVTGLKHHIDNVMKLLRGFSYRKYIDFGAFESLREMKNRIRQETLRRNLDDNVKLGNGGIREVEFIAQAFQLIRGGQERVLQNPNIFKVFAYLKKQTYLPATVVDELLNAYNFLRDSEHAIQSINDRQSQTLPTNSLDQARIAHGLGFDNWQNYHDALMQHRATVHHHFLNILAQEDEVKDAGDLQYWKHIWLNAEFPESIKETASERQNANEILQVLHAQSQKIQAIGKQRLDVTMPLLLKATWQCQQPVKTLARLQPLLESIIRRSAYLVLLNENPSALNQLVRLCDASPWIAQSITQAPILLDALLHPHHLFNPSNQIELNEDLNLSLLRIDENDLEEQMDALRHFSLSHKLQIAASDITDVLPLMKVSDHLTWLAQSLLDKSLALAWQQMVFKYGHPTNGDNEAVLSPEFIILGYGKLGGMELNYDSDLDMVFLHGGAAQKETIGPKKLENSVFYTRLGQRLIHILNTNTPAGQLYEVDMRLRPSGASGMIVASIAAFEKYQKQQAWTWEHQALIRARFICGDLPLKEQFEQVRADILTHMLAKNPDSSKLKQEVREMRQKMRDNLGAKNTGHTQFQLKQDAGGIVDIEFIVQYLVLAHGASQPELLEWTDNVRLLATLAQLGLLAQDESEALKKAYIAYRSTAHRRALQNQTLLLASNELNQAGLLPHINTVKAIWRNIMEP